MKPDPSLDVTREPVGLSSETEDAVIVGGVPAPENKRRRLVRGAVAFAPLVLTLRSGALAAASCTGVKIATGAYTKDGGLRAGKIKNAPGVVEGDVCVEAGALQECGTDQSRVETLSNLTVIQHQLRQGMTIAAAGCHAVSPLNLWGNPLQS